MTTDGFDQSREIVVLEGLHAIKHALRFGAEIVEIEAANRDVVINLAERLAPDVVDELAARVREVDRDYAGITGGVVARARQPHQALVKAVRRGTGPVVLLDRPRHLGNVGAAVRVAAAAGAEALVTTGDADPWHRVAIRGAAGLQFALPVGSVSDLRDTQRPVVALEPSGEPLDAQAIPQDSVLAFGSERFGLTREIRERADRSFALPMRRGVSSLNLAAAVAAALYSLRAMRARGLESRPPD